MDEVLAHDFYSYVIKSQLLHHVVFACTIKTFIDNHKIIMIVL